jgi:hypothetical protein
MYPRRIKNQQIDGMVPQMLWESGASTTPELGQKWSWHLSQPSLNHLLHLPPTWLRLSLPCCYRREKEMQYYLRKWNRNKKFEGFERTFYLKACLLYKRWHIWARGW